jgi:type IX secretion system PorP/SprF family membrane protein
LQAKFKILSFILLYFISNTIHGQDIHFSQYFNNPLSLSPAQTGNFDGDWRLYGNYRDQWRAIAYPFRTVSLGYDQQLILGDQHLAVGGYVVNDNSGSVSLKCNKVYISGAYYHTIDQHIFTGGLQVGFVMKSVNYDKVAFPDDWTGTNYDPGLVDEGDNNQVSYLDVNLGLGWKRKFGSKEFEAGIAALHLNHPTESFEGNSSSKLPLRMAINASLKLDIKSTLYVKPGILVNTMRGSRNIMVGGQTGMVVKSNKFSVREIYGGLYLRNGLVDPADAFMVMFGAQMKKIAINVSYDVNISSLHTYSNARGAFEISFVYKSLSAMIKTFTIPCERM